MKELQEQIDRLELKTTKVSKGAVHSKSKTRSTSHGLSLAVAR